MGTLKLLHIFYNIKYAKLTATIADSIPRSPWKPLAKAGWAKIIAPQIMVDLGRVGPNGSQQDK
jgi:hypothetical protein